MMTNSQLNRGKWKYFQSFTSSLRNVFILSLFLGIVTIYLLKSFNFNFENKSERNSRTIYDPEKPLPPSSSVLHTFKHTAISSDSEICSQIARDVMKNGGNAFDGTISALICLSLSQIQSMGVYGGFILTAYIKAEGKAVILDSQLTSPTNMRLPVKNVNDIKQGRLSVAVPGFLKGILEIHKKYGSVKWRSLIEPTIALCKKGVAITKHFYDSMHVNQNILNDHYLREVLIDKDTQKFKKPGSKIVFKKQCKFLGILADHDDTDTGSSVLEEVIMKDFVDAATMINKNDFKQYKSKWTEALEYFINDNDVMLLPNTGAVLIPSIINIIKEFNLNASSLNSEINKNDTILTHHRIIETFKHVFALRPHLSDPYYNNVTEITNKLLSEEFAKEIARRIDDEKTFHDPEKYFAKFIVPDNDGTSHLSLIAANGDAISVTSSINYYFGAGIAGNHTGLIFNNGMDDFSYPKRSFNYFGLKETPTNYPEPGKRALSSMSPIIVVDRTTGDVKLVIGAAGGSKIITALALAIMRFMCCTKDIKEIVDAPRFHHQLFPDEIEYEYGMIIDIVEGLVAKGHRMKRFNNRGTIVNALSRNDEGINGVADFRKDWSGVVGY